MKLFDAISSFRAVLGPTAAFAAKQVLNACIPGGAAIADLVGRALDQPDDVWKQAQEAAKAARDERWKSDIARRLGTTEVGLERVADLLAILRRDMAVLVADVADKQLHEDDVRKLIDDHPEWQRGRTALRDVAARVEKLEEQHKRWGDAGLNTAWIRTQTGKTTDGRRTPAVGDTVGGCVLEQSAADGGFGQVFRATRNGEAVALKVLRPEYANNSDRVEQFKKEIHVLRLLEKHPHPNRVQYLGHGKCPAFGCDYLIMTFIDGQPLDQLVRGPGRLNPSAALRYVRGVADSLVKPHKQGLSHGDIKPQNILVRPDGTGVLIDFGVARVEGYPGHTRAAGYTPEFASPEQSRGRTGDARSDVYSLAATLYYAVWRGDEASFDVEKFDPTHVPAALRPALDRSLSRNPDRRPADAAAFLAELPESLPTIVCASGTGDFAEIADAVRAASPGAHIRVRPGVYRKGVVLDKEVTIEGVPPRDRVVVETAGESCVVMRTAMATVRGLTLRATAGGAAGWFFGVEACQGVLLVEDCDITSDSTSGVVIGWVGNSADLKNCVIHNSKHCGVLVHDGAAGTIENCDIYANSTAGVEIRKQANPAVRNCVIRDGKAGGILVYDAGIGTIERCQIYGNNLASVEIRTQGNPVVRDCMIRDGQASGVYVHDSGVGTIEDCDIFGNALAGVEIKTQGNPVVRDCVIRDGQASGVYVHNAGAGTIVECQIHGNAYPGVAIQTQGNPTVRKCTIRDGLSTGVTVYDAGTGTLANCTIHGNVYAGVEIKTQGNPEVRDCVIRDGQQSGVYVHDGGKGFIEGGEVRGNKHAGLYIGNNGHPVVRKCKFAENATHGVQAIAGGRGVVEWCELSGNTLGAWSLDAASQVEQRNNSETPSETPRVEPLLIEVPRTLEFSS
jgi:parallel beta-helix repeat protein